jgi:hypothetical protein
MSVTIASAALRTDYSAASADRLGQGGGVPGECAGVPAPTVPVVLMATVWRLHSTGCTASGST